jgi:iron-sulfur cluster assembly accessory protein
MSFGQCLIRTASRCRNMPTQTTTRLLLANTARATTSTTLPQHGLGTTSRSFSSAAASAHQQESSPVDISTYTTATEQQLSEPVAVAVAAAPPTSTAAPKKQKKEPRRRTTLETKDPLLITPAAAVRIQELLLGDGAPDESIGIRLGVKRRGCNGLSYTLNYATEVPAKDIAMEAHGVKVFIEPMALFSIVGTTMDWEETELASEFTFSNPNSKGECGCGESFNV